MCHRRETDYSQNTYLGIHLGIKSLEAVLLNAELQVIHTAAVRYDADLPEFKTTNGINYDADSKSCTINPSMYTKALDMLLNCLTSQGANLHTVAAIGSAAHHRGAIYWSVSGFRALCGLSPYMRIHDQLTEKSFALCTTFSLNDPVKKLYIDMEKEVDGAEKLKAITGSKSFVRTTAVEIRKTFEDYPMPYTYTVRISLMSSFLASLFIGNIASIEFSEASRMNLLDIAKKDWSPECLNACAPDLRSRLMKPIATNRLQGRVSDYFVSRWNFRSDCMVVSAIGSSASMLASLKSDNSCLFLTLGETDEIVTKFNTRPNLEDGHILCHPTSPNAYLGWIPFRNGGQVRNRICREVANGEWSEFNEMLLATPMGNDGHIAVHFDEQEYMPEIQGTLRWDKDVDEASREAHHGIDQFPEPKWEARAVIEGQLMYIRGIAARSGFSFNSNAKIIATGSCSDNDNILQIVADICNAPVFRVNGPDAHVLGAAYRARYAFYEHREENCNCQRCRNRRDGQARLLGGHTTSTGKP